MIRLSYQSNRYSADGSISIFETIIGEFRASICNYYGNSKDRKHMSVIELQTSYDITGPHNAPDTSLCSSCKIKGKSFLCLVIKRAQYPLVDHCNEYIPSNK